MERYFVIKDGSVVASCPTREAALATIRTYQSFETHYLLKASFSIIKGAEELVPYEKGR